MALYLLYADNEPSAEVYGAAADRQQASIVFDVARQMVEMTPALVKRSKIMTAGKRIVNYSNAGYYQVLSAEVGCVAPDTIIQMQDGSIKRADEVRAGDMILSFDGRKPCFDKVVSVKEEAPAEMLEVVTHYGRKICVTEHHPFYAKRDSTYDWAEACELKSGDSIAVGLGWPNDYQKGSEQSVDGIIHPAKAWRLGAMRNGSVPDEVWKGGPSVWSSYIAGFLGEDGDIPATDDNNSPINEGSREDVRQQMQLLLARLGVNAVLHRDGTLEVLCNSSESMSLDKVKSITPVGKQKSISYEMEQYQTHSTNGLITHNTKHGLNVSGLVFDELHSQPNRQLYDVLTKGSGDAREQPLYFLITTAGTDRESICYEVHTKAMDILTGRKIDPSFYPVVFGLADDDDWNDEANWYKANPSLGYTIQIDRVRAAYKDALENPAEENVFRQLRLDQWVGSSVAWIPEHIYDRGNIPIDLNQLKGRDCYAGLDLSSTSDITAFVMVFPPETEGDNYVIVPHFWLPRDTLALRVRRDHVPYDVWERQGLFHVTEGNVVDYNFVRKTINELGTQFHICEIGVDRWNATQLITDLDGDGFTMVPIGMGYKDMSPGMKELYKLFLEGKITHGGNPVLRWMAGNVVAEIDAAENIKPSKKKSTEKIDGIVATIMGLDRCIRHEQQGSVYDLRDLYVF